MTQIDRLTALKLSVTATEHEFNCLANQFK